MEIKCDIIVNGKNVPDFGLGNGVLGTAIIDIVEPDTPENAQWWTAIYSVTEKMMNDLVSARLTFDNGEVFVLPYLGKDGTLEWETKE